MQTSLWPAWKMSTLLNMTIVLSCSALTSCFNASPEYIAPSSSGNRLAATETATRDDKVKEIQILYRIVEKSTMDAATKASIEARLNAALQALNDPSLDSATLAKIIADISSVNDDIAKVTGTATTATATAAPDTSPPPALSTFSGATGTASAAIDLTIGYPSNTSDYDLAVIRRSPGASAPTDCSAGSSVKTYSTFSDVVYTDVTPSGGSTFSYRVCIYDAAGNVTSSNTATNITSYTFTHTIFTSSTTYTGNLGGYSGADAKCQSVASGAGLSGTWRAILSGASSNAKDRIIISGSIYNRLGVLVATSKTDFWDGVLSADIGISESAATINSGESIWTDSSGSGSVWAGANGCVDWTSTSASISAKFGYSNIFGDNRWIQGGAIPCSGSTPGHLYCISQPAGFDLTAFSATTGSGNNGDVSVTITFPATSTQFQNVDVRRISGATPPSSDCASDGTVVKTFSAGGFTSQTFTDATGGSGVQYSYRACVYDTVGTLQSSSYASKVIAKGTTHKIFVTSTSYTGNLGGASGADAKCVTRATAAGLANAATYKALISETGNPANTRVTISGPIYNLSNDLIASNLGDLWDATTSNGIGYTEFATAIVPNQWSWTGTTSAGGISGWTCTDWTDGTAGGGGMVGNGSNTDSGWVSAANVACNNTYPLYCISQ